MAVVATAGWLGLQLLTWTRFAEPAPHWLRDLMWPLFIPGALVAGLVAAVWPALLLAAVPYAVILTSGWYDRMTEPLPVGEFAVVGLLPVIGLGIWAGRRLPGWVRVVGVGLLAVATIPLAVVAGMRHVSPVDRHPAHPVLVDLATGRVGPLRVGVATAQGAPGVAFDGWGLDGGNRLPIEVPEAAEQYSDTLVSHLPDRTVFARHGAVTAIMLTDGRYQTAEGVGPGDNLGLVSRRYPDARCESSRQVGVPECSVRVGRVTAWFVDDPIATVAMTVPARRQDR
ncbi:MAG: hypothetical protein U0Y82_11925 [Thermoleophilia bacterium]